MLHLQVTAASALRAAKRHMGRAQALKTPSARASTPRSSVGHRMAASVAHNSPGRSAARWAVGWVLLRLLPLLVFKMPGPAWSDGGCAVAGNIPEYWRQV